MRLVAPVLAFVSVLALASCSSQRGGGLPSVEQLRNIPGHQAATYAVDIAATLAKSVPERLAVLPPLALDYLRKIDARPDYAAYSPSQGERELFSAYYALLPTAFKAAMEAKLLGVYFVEGFAGGGMTDFALGADPDSLYLVLVLNPKTLRLSLADWIAYRDGSPYAADASGLELRSTCPGGEKYRGLLHTLTHEAAHIYDYANRATPFVEPALARYPGLAAPASAADRDFTRGIWESYAKPSSTLSIPKRESLAPYGLGPSLPISIAEEQYKALAGTPFASLYGAGSWAEDFAEAAAWTHLRDRLGIGYEVAILKNEKEEFRFAPDQSRWSEARRQYIGRILAP